MRVNTGEPPGCGLASAGRRQTPRVILLEPLSCVAMAASRKAAGVPAAAPGRSIPVGDIFATAFVRYGGGFATYGVMSLAAALLPGLAITALALADSGQQVNLVVVAITGTLAYFVLLGAVTASIGGRLRTHASAVLLTAIVAMPAVALVIALFRALA